MSCNAPGCRKNKQRSRRPIPGVQQTASAIVADKIGSDKVLVRYNLGSRHRQGVRGRVTRIFYGKHTHGDVFEMHKADQQLQPDKYVLVNPTAVNMANGPMNRSAAPPIAPPAPVPAVKRVDVQADAPPVAKVLEQLVEEKIVDVSTEYVDADDDEEFEVDIAIMPLRAIKQLGLDPEDALTALEVERGGRKRKNVLDYLEMKAQPAIEAAAEYDHEYADDDDYDEDYDDDDEDYD